MRPVSLTMSAFGPFSDTQKIRFSDFSQNALFLINGPTGAGKTTLLDGICFALYGRTTGNEREGGQMRCDMADAAVLTEVIFEFSLAEYQYRIRRVPEQARKKSRGDGFTQQKPEAQLYRTGADGNESLLVETKVSQATSFIENILGLDVEQFRQVMVLPQGKFRELLMADSKSRENIFGQLFQTRIYRRIEDKLKQQAGEVRQRVQAQRNKREGVLQAVSLETDEQLNSGLSELSPKVERAEKEKNEQHKLLLEITKKLEYEKRLQQQFAELERQRQLRQTLSGQQAEIEAKQGQILKAQSAVAVMPVFEVKQQRQNEFNQLRSQNNQAQARFENAKQANDAAIKAAESIPDLERDIRARGQELQRLTEIEPLMVNKNNIAQALAQLRQQQSSAQQRLMKQEQNLKSLQEQKLGLQHQQSVLREQAERQTEYQTRQFQWRQTQEKLINLNGKQAGLAALNQQLNKAESDEQNLKDAYEHQVKHHDLLRFNWYQSQAAILARQLQPGEACPVCGGSEHPHPAKTSIDPPSEVELQQAQDAQSAALTQLNEASSACQHFTRQIKQVETEINGLTTELDTTANISVAECERRLNSVSRQLAQSKTAADQLNQLQSQYRQAERQEAELNNGLEQVRAQLNTLNPQIAGLTAQLAEINKRLTDDITDLTALNARKAGLRQQAETSGKQLTCIRNAQTQAAQNLAAAEASMVSLTQQLESYKEALRKAGDELAAALLKAEFADERTLLNADLPAEVKLTLESEISAYQRQCTVNASKINELEKALKDKRQPSVEALREIHKQELRKHQKADQEWQQLNAQFLQLKQVRNQLAELDKSTADLEDEYAVAGTLADVANGQTGNRISLNRFVLSVLLDDVLIDASRRLHLMSKGRYRLLRKEDKAKGNKASGLELEVEDAYTSKVRDVATLSGGESFMAALSLALALSEVVQAYAGGIKLDTLFIDEGFGSLDQDSLELAIRTLVDLQSSGRMIGVISHVTEMKEQIEKRIDIHKSSSGSRIKLLAG